MAELPDSNRDTSASSSDQTMPDLIPSSKVTPPTQKARYDWYQTETHVVVTILVKGAKQENVKVDISEKQINSSLIGPDDTNHSLNLHLSHAIVPSQSSFKVMPTKTEVKLKKVEGIHWSKLEGEEETNVKHFKPTETGAAEDNVHKYPTSSHVVKDWDKMVAQIKKEEKDEKVEGDAALNQLFQQIYSDGSDEVRRAMNKSFVESKGTVLSTNWSEIGQKPVEVKPPDGMEYKKYDS